VHVGRREGVCRDFAVLGYCEAGIECSKQHVRECPDFAESGECPNKRCKLPHVIRANRTRKPASASVPAADITASVLPVDDKLMSDVVVPALTVQDSQLGDEYISLTFNESEEDEDSDDDDEDEDDEEEEEEGDNPNPGDEDAADD
jgi:hypothetical protein